MRVLYISGGDAKYGAPKSMMTLMMTLRELYGIEPVLLTKKHNELNDYCDKHGIENYSFWYRDIMAGSPYRNVFLTFAKHCVKIGVYAYGSVTMKNIDRLPINFENIDLIHTNHNRLDIGCYIAQKYNKKHIWHIREMGKEDYNVIFYKKNCIQYMNEYADEFISISNCVTDKWVGLGIRKKKITTIYDGLEAEKIAVKSNIENFDTIKIVITGHVQPNKGQLQIVKALALLPESIKNHVTLDIIGETYKDYKTLIDKAIKDNNLEENVHFLGYRDNIFDLLCNYDVGFTGSKAEGYGRCTVEYMMAGLLTLASNTGANPELIEDKKTGLLYEYGNTENLAKQLEWIIENNELCKQIAHDGCQMAREKYTQYKCAEQTYEVYKKCLIK